MTPLTMLLSPEIHGGGSEKMWQSVIDYFKSFGRVAASNNAFAESVDEARSKFRRAFALDDAKLLPAPANGVRGKEKVRQ